MEPEINSQTASRSFHSKNKRVRQKKQTQQKLLLLMFIIFVFGFFAGFLIGRNQITEITFLITESEVLQEEVTSTSLGMNSDSSKKGNTIPENLPWYLTLVNFEYPLENDFAPASLAVANNSYETDSRIADITKTMIADARKEGVRIIAISAFRDYDYQTELFENKVIRLQQSKGYSVTKAREEAATVVAYPGTSEHQLGLALDLVDARHVKLDESQENTAAYQWLFQHCAEYGFIVRYPNGKTEITGIIYEPWHFRYVGEQAAKVIMEKEITLEEYLLEYYEQ